MTKREAKARQEQEKCLKLYMQYNGNLSKVERTKGTPSYPTLLKWKQQGLPLAVTDGLPWDEYLRREQLAMEKARIKAGLMEEMEAVVPLEEMDDIEEADEFDMFKRETLEVFKTVVNKYKNEMVDIKLSDANAALRLYMYIDGQQKKVLKFAEDFAKKVLRSAKHYMSEQDFLLFREDVLSGVDDIREKAEAESKAVKDDI